MITFGLKNRQNPIFFNGAIAYKIIGTQKSSRTEQPSGQQAEAVTGRSRMTRSVKTLTGYCMWLTSYVLIHDIYFASCRAFKIRYMSITHIETYLATLPANRRTDMQRLHQLIQDMQPQARLWYLDGRNSEGRIVSNPSIGYGRYTIHYADGSMKEFYQVGISANTAGITVYIMGHKDKSFLTDTYGSRLGKASVTGYCIKFKKLADIHLEVLQEALSDALCT